MNNYLNDSSNITTEIPDIVYLALNWLFKWWNRIPAPENILLNIYIRNCEIGKSKELIISLLPASKLEEWNNILHLSILILTISCSCKAVSQTKVLNILWNVFYRICSMDAVINICLHLVNNKNYVLNNIPIHNSTWLLFFFSNCKPK